MKKWEVFDIRDQASARCLDARDSIFFKYTGSVDDSYFKCIKGCSGCSFLLHAVAHNLPIVMINDREEPTTAVFFGPELGVIYAPHHIRGRFLYGTFTMTTRCTPVRYPALPVILLHHSLHPLLSDHEVSIKSHYCPYPSVPIVEIVRIPDHSS